MKITTQNLVRSKNRVLAYPAFRRIVHSNTLRIKASQTRVEIRKSTGKRKGPASTTVEAGPALLRIVLYVTLYVLLHFVAEHHHAVKHVHENRV